MNTGYIQSVLDEAFASLQNGPHSPHLLRNAGRYLEILIPACQELIQDRQQLIAVKAVLQGRLEAQKSTTTAPKCDECGSVSIKTIEDAAGTLHNFCTEHWRYVKEWGSRKIDN